jgi:hypothetical protein
VRLSTDGHKYLGGHIDSEQGNNEYILRSLLQSWSNLLRVLSDIAKCESQAANTAFLFGFPHRFTYHIRTIPDIQHQLQMIDYIFDTELLPALTASRNLSLQDRKLLELPTCLGRLGIPILSDMCAMEFENPKRYYFENHRVE